MNTTTFNHNNPPSVQALRKMGFRVTVIHQRPVVEAIMAEIIPQLPIRTAEKIIRQRFVNMHHIRQLSFQDRIFPRGGETEIIIEKDNLKLSAKSECSILDSFNRKSGINRCLWRLVGQLNHINEPQA